MAVDSLREKHHINRISTTDLGILWSAQSYRPEITTALREIRSQHWAPLSALCKNKIGPGPHPHFAAIGHPCLKTKNVLGITVDCDDVDLVEPADASRWDHYRIDKEDLVLNITGAGSIGRVGMYFHEDRPLTNQHLARLSITDDADSGYVCAFLASWWGERALEQGIGGSTGQLNLVNEHIRQLPIPLPDKSAQRYIGDKIRMAERLRSFSRDLERQAREFFALDQWSLNQVGVSSSYRVPASRLSPARLDAQFFDPGHYELENLMRGRGASPVGEVAEGPRHGWSGSSQIVYYDIGSLDLATGRLAGTRMSASAAPSRAQIAIRRWDVLVSTVRPNRKNVGIVTDDSAGATMVASTGFAVVRFSTPEEAVFYHSYLRSDAATAQLIRWNAGGTYPAIDHEVVLEVLAPNFDQETVEQLGRRWLAKFLAEGFADALTNAARALAEGLIGGTVQEADLVAAQNELTSGGCMRDSEVLRNLVRDESGGPGRGALFAGTEEFHALLRETGVGIESERGEYK